MYYNISMPVQQLHFYFKGTFLYIALYNGDIIVLFDQGSGVQPILGSRDLFIADGLAHTIFLDFSFQNRFVVNFNDYVIVYFISK